MVVDIFKEKFKGSKFSFFPNLADVLNLEIGLVPPQVGLERALKQLKQDLEAHLANARIVPVLGALVSYEPDCTPLYSEK